MIQHCSRPRRGSNLIGVASPAPHRRRFLDACLPAQTAPQSSKSALEPPIKLRLRLAPLASDKDFQSMRSPIARLGGFKGRQIMRNYVEALAETDRLLQLDPKNELCGRSSPPA